MFNITEVDLKLTTMIKRTKYFEKELLAIKKILKDDLKKEMLFKQKKKEAQLNRGTSTLYLDSGRR